MEVSMNQHKLADHFRRNPEANPRMEKDTKVFYFGATMDKSQKGIIAHNGVITAYWEPTADRKSALVGFAFCDPRDKYDRTESKRGLLRLRSYGSVRGEGHRMKIRNSKFVVEISQPSTDGAIHDVVAAFQMLRDRKVNDRQTNETREVIPVAFRDWEVASRTYINKQNQTVTVPVIQRKK
jgi:hypothetical protein